MKLPPGAPNNMANFQHGIQQAIRKPCLLCGRSPVTACTWFPSPEIQAKLKVPGGKFRTFFYSLCGRCYLLPDRDTRIESRILREYFQSEPA